MLAPNSVWKTSKHKSWKNSTINTHLPLTQISQLIAFCPACFLSLSRSLPLSLCFLLFFIVRWLFWILMENPKCLPSSSNLSSGLKSKLCLPRRWNISSSFEPTPVLLSAGFLGLLPYACIAEEPEKNLRSFTQILRPLPLATSLLGSLPHSPEATLTTPDSDLSPRPREPVALLLSSISNTELGSS